jgi:hypothetical protein
MHGMHVVAVPLSSTQKSEAFTDLETEHEIIPLYPLHTTTTATALQLHITVSHMLQMQRTWRQSMRSYDAWPLWIASPMRLLLPPFFSVPLAPVLLLPGAAVVPVVPASVLPGSPAAPGAPPTLLPPLRSKRPIVESCLQSKR